MNKYVKGSLIFTGGVVSGGLILGVGVIRVILNSNTYREMIWKEIGERIGNALFETGMHSPSKEMYYGSRHNIIFNTREEAVSVIGTMQELFTDYGAASLADLYDLCGLMSNYTDNASGWDNSDDISKFKVNRTQFGYELIFPKPKPLNTKEPNIDGGTE